MSDKPEQSATPANDKAAPSSPLRSPIRPTAPPGEPLRSPIRPTMPGTASPPPAQRPDPPQTGLLNKAAKIADSQAVEALASGPLELPDHPQAALEMLRRKMESVASEFGEGKINRAQFNAIYGRYSEQRTIIERLLQKDPKNQAWKQAAAPGHTSFLRQHFEARLMYFLVFQHNMPTALMMGGKQQPNMDQISNVLRALWGMPNRPKIGLARKEMGNGYWLVLALGDHAVTLTMFHLEPSAQQATLVRDLHLDFERANRRALSTGTRSLERFVFPQRALTEKEF